MTITVPNDYTGYIMGDMNKRRGSYDLEFERYEEAPNDVANKVIETRKREQENK